jgi:hypothetical protein
MGKRELLLIAGFVILGSAIYWATAPPAEPGQRGFSLASVIAEIRREIRGNPGTAEVKTTTTLPKKAELTEVRFEFGNASTPLTVVGETRDDISCELSVWSNGPDEAEAKRFASETKLRVNDLGTSLVLGVDYPQPGEQRASLSIRMPSSLAVRVQPSRGRITISNLASLELAEARGQVTVNQIKDRVAITHRGGELKIEGVAALKLSTRGSMVQLRDVKGEAVLQTNAGDVRGWSLTGSIDIDSTNTKIALDDLAKSHKPIKINAIGGEVVLDGVSSQTRIDGRKTRIAVAMAQPVPVAIYNDDEETTRLTLPPAGGIHLDALASDAKITLPDGLLDVKSSGTEQRASGAVRGGGPTVTLRSSRGAIVVTDAPATSSTPTATPKEKTGS